MSLPRAARVASYDRRTVRPRSAAACACASRTPRARAPQPPSPRRSPRSRRTPTCAVPRGCSARRGFGPADHRARGVAARVRAPEPPHDARSSTHRAFCPPTEAFARSRNCAVCPPRSSDQRPSASEKPTSWRDRSFLDRRARGGRVALGKSVMRFQSDKLSLIYHISKTEILYNTIFERIGCRMDRSRGSRGSGSGALLRWIAFFLLCARTVASSLRLRGGRKTGTTTATRASPSAHAFVTA